MKKLISTNAKGSKAKVLFLIQLPPPIHGVSIINEHIYTLPAIDNLCKKDIIELKFSSQLKTLSKISFDKVFRTISIAFRLMWKCLRFNPSYIYFTISPSNKTFYRDLVFVFIIKAFNKKPIYHLHGKGISDNIKRRPILRRVYRWVFNNSVIIHLSEGLLKSEIIPLTLKNATVKVLNNGIEKNTTIKNINIDDKEDTLLFLSNLFPSKGIFVFLDAIKEVKEIFPLVRVNIVGDTINEEILKKININIKKNNLQSNIILHGRKFGNEKNDVFENSKLFVHPTLNDAFPLVILEALQYGLPVVSTFEGAISEIINNQTGVLVAKNKPNELAAAIVELLNDKERMKSMSYNCKKHFNENYTMEVFEKKLSKIFFEIIN